MSLSPGFTPDPHVMSGLSGGDQNATSLSAECRGYISAEPNHIFTAAGSFTSLRLLVNGGAEDTTLVVQKPDGSYVCNDDAEGHDPVIANVAFPAGIYRVWVGSYTQGVRARYNIGFTEIASVNVARIGLPAGAALPPAAQPTPPPPPSGDLSSNYGTITLAPGFMPDPSVATGTAGGPVLAEGWDSSCAGSVAQIPDHIFVATGDFSFLKIFVSAPEDTTLVLQKPDGSFSCNDDDDDLNPGIAGAFAPGSYRIWVGAYEASARPQYRLGISEVSSTNASDL